MTRENDPAKQGHRHIITGLASVSTFIIIAKICGALKEVAVAARYGTNPAADAYAYVFSLLSSPLAIWTSTLAVILIPLLVRANKEKPGQIETFQGEFFTLSLLLGSVLGVFCGAALGAVLLGSASGLPAAAVHYASWMAAPLAFILPFGFASTLFATQLMVSRRHTNSLFEGIPSFCLMVTVLVYRDNDGRSLVIGTLAGFACQMVALILAQPDVTRAVSFTPRFSSPLWKEVWRYSLIVVLSVAILNITGVIDQVMVAHLGDNANATLGYATRLLALLTGLGATAVGRALLPVLSELRTSQGGQEHDIAMRWAWILFLVGICAAGLGWATARVGVHLAFERGAFSAQDTTRVADALRFGFLQLPFYFAGIVVSQLIASHSRYKIFLFSNCVGLAVKFVGNLVLIPAMGIKGAFLATAIMYAATTGVLLASTMGVAQPKPPQS